MASEEVKTLIELLKALEIPTEETRECVNKSASFSESGCNILHHACRYGLLDLVQANLNAQVDVTVRNKDGENAIFIACKYGHVNIVVLLLENMKLSPQEPQILPCVAGDVLDVPMVLQKASDDDGMIQYERKLQQELKEQDYVPSVDCVKAGQESMDTPLQFIIHDKSEDVIQVRRLGTPEDTSTSIMDVYTDSMNSMQNEDHELEAIPLLHMPTMSGFTPLDQDNIEDLEKHSKQAIKEALTRSLDKISNVTKTSVDAIKEKGASSLQKIDDVMETDVIQPMHAKRDTCLVEIGDIFNKSCESIKNARDIGLQNINQLVETTLNEITDLREKSVTNIRTQEQLSLKGIKDAESESLVVIEEMKASALESIAHLKDKCMADILETQNTIQETKDIIEQAKEDSIRIKTEIESLKDQLTSGDEKAEMRFDGTEYNECLYCEDHQGRNCLYIAAENKQSEVVKILLSTDTSVWKRLVQTEFILTDKVSKLTTADSPLRSILRNMPDLAMPILDKYIEVDENRSSVWHCDYTLFPSQKYSNNNTFLKRIFQCNTGREKTLMKEQHPLMLAYTSTEEKLVRHPVVATLLNYKWRKLRVLHFIMLLFYLLFMIFMTSYMLTAQRFTEVAIVGSHLNDSHIERSTSSSAHQEILALILFTLSCLGILVEILQIILMRSMYVISMDHMIQNLLDWFMYISCIYVVMFPLDGLRTSTQWQIGCTCMIITWFNFLLHHPCFSHYLYMIVGVVQEFWRFTLVFLIFLMLFGLSFAVVLNHQDAHADIFGSVIRTWTMMLGDISYTDMFNPPAVIPYVTVTYALFIMFLFLGLIITNIWTGFIINRISELEESANKYKLVLQLDYILTIECVLPSCLRRFFVYENKKQRVVIKEKHPIIPILCALVGDMTFRLADKPTTEVLTKNEKRRQREDLMNVMRGLLSELETLNNIE